MTTRTLLPSTSINPKTGFTQKPQDALDLDGFKDAAIYARVDNWGSGGSTLEVTITHGARTGANDQLELLAIDLPTGAGSTFSYQSQFLRYLNVGVNWSNPANSSNAASLEILVDAK